MVYKNKEDYKKYQKKYRKENSEYFNQKHKEWRQRNKKQFSCNVTFQKYKHYHKIKTGKCCLCLENKNIEGHHQDYSKPLVVTWLCKKCHERSHSTEMSLVGMEVNIKL